MNFFSRLFFLLSVLIITVNSAQAEINLDTTKSSAMPEITADNKSYDFSTGEWLLTGNVSIRSDKWTAQADQVRVHPTKLNVSANGNVRLSWPAQDLEIKANQATFDPDRQIAQVNGSIRLRLGAFEATAESGTYHVTTRTADLFGQGDTPASLYPSSGGYLSSQGIHCDINQKTAFFTQKISFELYKKNSGSGIKGTATEGSYEFATESANLNGSIQYHTIPSGKETEVSALTFNSQN